MSYKYQILIILLLIRFDLSVYSQAKITGQIIIDTTIWKPVAYLSLIPDLDKLFTMSGNLIIDKSEVDSSGTFKFDISYLPPEDYLYRIHITKKGDPAASLIIGGRNENYLLLIANSKSNITIVDTSRINLIKDALVSGYYPNNGLKNINELRSYLDSTTFNGTPIRLELIKSTIYDKLKVIADTCSNSLVSLYALYQTDFEKDFIIDQFYYRNFLKKWRGYDSSYLNTFRKRVPLTKNISLQYFILFCFLSLVIGLIFGYKLMRSKRADKNILFDLTIQERKIFGLLLDGKSNKEISDDLNIGLSTVKTHITSIYSKLGISSRKEALNLNMTDNKTDNQNKNAL
jgi:DNA-binding CsgD family transcriptional regulator